MNVFGAEGIKAQKQGERGFTLVELLVAIAIMAVVMAIAVPNYLGYLPRIRLKAASRNIVGDMQLAKVHAIRNAKTAAIKFNPGAGTYQVIIDAGETTGSEDWDDGDEIILKTVALSAFKGVSYGSPDGSQRPGDATAPGDGVTFTNDTVTFDRQSTSVTGTVYLKNEKGEGMAVGTSSAAGRVKSWHNYGSGWEE